MTITMADNDDTLIIILYFAVYRRGAAVSHLHILMWCSPARLDRVERRGEREREMCLFGFKYIAGPAAGQHNKKKVWRKGRSCSRRYSNGLPHDDGTAKARDRLYITRWFFLCVCCAVSKNFWRGLINNSVTKESNKQSKKKKSCTFFLNIRPRLKSFSSSFLHSFFFYVLKRCSVRSTRFRSWTTWAPPPPSAAWKGPPWRGSFSVARAPSPSLVTRWFNSSTLIIVFHWWICDIPDNTLIRGTRSNL